MRDQPHHAERFRLGRDRLARAVGLLLTRNELSHQDLEELSAWAAPDEEAGTWLAKSQISSLRNGKLPKPGPQILVALATANQALAALAHGVAPDRALPRHLRKILPDPWFLAHPVTGQPMGPGDWFEVLAGELTTDELGDGAQVYSDDTAMIASEQFALLVQAWQLQQRIPLAQLRLRLEEQYTERSAARRDRLWRVALGEYRWTGEELGEERDALRFTVGALEGSNALSPRALDQWIRSGPGS
jgi:hypothetical protein